MKDLVFKTSIAASVEKVWNTMLQPETYQLWVAAAWPNSWYVGDWAAGAEIRFVGTDGSGMLAKTTVYEPYERVVIEHVAVLLAGGIEDRKSEMATSLIGATESYTFTAQGDITELSVVMCVKEQWEEMFVNDWPKALSRLKEICEADKA